MSQLDVEGVRKTCHGRARSFEVLDKEAPVQKKSHEATDESHEATDESNEGQASDEGHEEMPPPPIMKAMK